ncbi:replication initiation protein [Tortoise microvirus 92]|nr:replication initiation protein [Tortoise microvirus 92]
MALCKKPFRQGSQSFGCGQCIPCLIQRRRTWTHRLMLESYSHESAAFVTLTYDPENEPPGRTLVRRDVTLWLDKFRKKVLRKYGRRIRYYYVGEYGDENSRPHYHIALYGGGFCHNGRSIYSKTQKTCCPFCDLVLSTWEKGLIHVDELNPTTAQYVCGYVTKKMTHPESKCTDKCTHPPLNGRKPEFSSMSKKPGIGALAITKVADALTTDGGATTIINDGDVPLALAHGRKKMPIGRYLRTKIRERYGFEETGTPKELLLKLQQDARDLEEMEARIYEEEGRSPTEYYRDRAATRSQKIRNIETKFKIWSKKGTL